jgi:hypothetical protein
MRSTKQATHCRLAALVLLLTGLHALAWGWSPFGGTKSEFEEVPLTSAEWSQVQVKAGWATGYPDDLLFEVASQLPGPMACHGVNVQLTSGKKIDKGFNPRLYVPSGSIKQVGVRGVAKGQMKDFTLACGCWKKPTDTRCGNPARP